MHATLEAHPESKRSKGEYKKVIDAYFEVYRLNPGYIKTPVALTAIAELYREMGALFPRTLIIWNQSSLTTS